MATQLTIYSITGQSPFDIYVCQTGGTSCFYMTTISSVPYTFNIPAPYDNLSTYMLKVIDTNGCVISGISNVIPCTPLDCTLSGGTVIVLDCTLTGGTVTIVP
jgi:hypothetical protein